MILLNKALSENNYMIVKQIINEFTPTKNANLLEILGGILLQMNDTINAEKFFNQSIKFYSKQKEDYASFNVRRQYTRQILASRHDFKKAWKVLSLPKKTQTPDAVAFFNYEKGRLCAIDNYKNNDGILYLQSCLEHIEVLYDWGISEKNIFFYIAMCYKNISNKKSAIDYIEKALKIDPQNEQYLFLRDNINKMEELENPEQSRENKKKCTNGYEIF
jgi:tetratricopeptide (TPR) repeat protein